MSKEIQGVQYLRAIAAIAVVVDHAAGMAAFPKYFDKDIFLKSYWLKGAMGVDLFFMISGFIIATAYLAPRTLAPTVSRKEFFWRRFVRIVPLMWLAIVSYALLRLVGRSADDPEWGSYFRALILSPVGELKPNVIWTLRHEAIFYILFALTFLGEGRQRIVMLLWAAAPLFYALSGAEPGPKGGWIELLWALSHPANVLFGLGFLVGMVRLKWELWRPIQVRGFLWVLLAIFLLCMWVGWSLDLTVDRFPKSLISAIVLAPLLLLAIWGEGGRSRLGLLLAEASYAIYLFHLHCVSGAFGFLARLKGVIPAEVAVLVVVLLTVGACLVVHLVIERPMISWLRRVRLRSGSVPNQI